MSRLTENLKSLEEMGKLNRYIMNILENSLEEHDKEIRNKAIDEFAERLFNCGMGDFNNIPISEIKRIAEQMKGGANSED